MSHERTSDDTSRKLRVFLCHSKSDKPTVRNLYHRLQADNFEAWLDEENLVPGQEWELEILRAVRAADIVVVCLSKGSVTKAGFIQKEIKLALDVADMQPEGTIFLIPLRLEECQVPERLRRWQWVNLYEEQGYGRLIRALSVRYGQITSSVSLISRIEQSSLANLEGVQVAGQNAPATPHQPDINSGAALTRQRMEADTASDLLKRWNEGDKEARDELFTREYSQLMLIAKMRARGEWESEGLQPEELLHELYIKLLSLESVNWLSREHFLAVASNLMRHILIDMARRKYRAKRSTVRLVEEKEAKELISLSRGYLDDFEEALRLLEKLDPRAAQVVMLLIYGGLSIKEIAETLEVSPMTVNRDWHAAKLWLRAELR